MSLILTISWLKEVMSNNLGGPNPISWKALRAELRLPWARRNSIYGLQCQLLSKSFQPPFPDSLPYRFFFFFWLRWVFVAARGLSLVAASGGYSSLRCVGFSLWWLLLLLSMGSRCTGFSSCGLRALESRLSSCGTWAYLFRGMWDLPGPGLKLVSPALAGGFLTTVPSGKSCPIDLNLPSQLPQWLTSQYHYYYMIIYYVLYI